MMVRSPKKTPQPLLQRSPSEEDLLREYHPARVTMITTEPITDDDDVINMTTSSLSVTLADSEHAVRLAGGFGPYQLGFLLALQLLTVIVAGNYSLMQYSTLAPIVTCTTENQTALVLSKTTRTHFCAVYNKGNCSRVTWDSPFHTIIEEWKLICDRDFIPEMMNSVQTGGSLLTAILSGIIADRYGRRKVFLCSFVLLITANMLVLFTRAWWQYMIMRTIGTLSYYTATSTVFIWGMELYDARHNIINNISGLWSLGYVVSALIGYMSHTWRRMLLALNVLSVPLLLIYWRFVESPRWLVQKGRLDEAAKALTTMARANRPHQMVTFTAANLRGIATDSEDDVPVWEQIARITGNRTLAFNLAVQCIITFTTGSVAQGFLFQITLMSGSPFLSFAILGGMRLVLMPCIYIVDRRMVRLGRRHIVILPLVFIGVCYAIEAASKIGWYAGHTEAIEFYTLLLAACATSFLWIGLGQYTVELFPTTVRNTASGIAYMFDPIAGIISPQFVYLEEHYWRAIQSVYLLSLVAVTTLVAYIALPETKGNSAPDTINDSRGIVPPVVEPLPKSCWRWMTRWRAVDDDEGDNLVDEWQDDDAVPHPHAHVL